MRWRSAFDTLVTGGGHGLQGSIASATPGHETIDGGESVASQLLKSATSRAELVKTLSRHGSALLSFAHNENATTPSKHRHLPMVVLPHQDLIGTLCLRLAKLVETAYACESCSTKAGYHKWCPVPPPTGGGRPPPLCLRLQPGRVS